MVDNSKARFRIRGFYFLFFAAVGSIFPYLNLYYQRAGLTGRQIGALSAIMALVTQLASPLWGMLGDSRTLQRRLLPLAVGGTIIPAVLLSLNSELSWLVPVTMIYAFFFGPISPLVDSTALEVIESGEQSYGELRVWGTVGFIVSALAVGRIIEVAGLGVLFAGYVLFMLGCLAVSVRFPPRRRQWTGPAIRGLGVLLANRAFLQFLASVFVLSVAVRASNDFFALYLDAVGAKEGLVGLAWAIAALSEVPVVLFSGILLKKLGSRKLLALGCSVYALRWFLYSQVSSPGLILVIQLMHGLSYGSYLVAGVVYTSEQAPEGLGATAQGLYFGTTMGVAAIAGALMGGWVYDLLGVANLFAFCSMAAAFALVLLLFSPRAKPALASYEEGGSDDFSI